MLLNFSFMGVRLVSIDGRDSGALDFFGLWNGVVDIAGRFRCWGHKLDYKRMDKWARKRVLASDLCAWNNLSGGILVMTAWCVDWLVYLSKVENNLRDEIFGNPTTRENAL